MMDLLTITDLRAHYNLSFLPTYGFKKIFAAMMGGSEFSTKSSSKLKIRNSSTQS